MGLSMSLRTKAIILYFVFPIMLVGIFLSVVFEPILAPIFFIGLGIMVLYAGSLRCLHCGHNYFHDLDRHFHKPLYRPGLHRRRHKCHKLV